MGVVVQGMIFIPTFFVHGQGSPSDNRITNPLGATTTLMQLLLKILDVVVLIGVPVLVMAIIWVGFMYVKAQGKPEDIKTANNAFLWTVVGAGVVMGAKIISLALCSTVHELGAAITRE